MATFEITRNGVTRDVTINEGDDTNAKIDAAFGTAALSVDAVQGEDPLKDLPGIPTFEGDQAIGFDDTPPRSAADQAKRALGLGARVLPSAALKLPASLADLASSAINAPIAGLDFIGEKVFGDKPLPRLPTDTTAGVQDFLNEIFPEPTSFPERIVEGIGDLALPGVAGAALAVPRAVSRIGEGTQAVGKSGIPFTQARAESAIPALSSIAPAEGTIAKAPGLIESIGTSASRSPKTFATLESTGAAGTEIASELADDADAGPLARTAAILLGGITGVVAPQAGLNVTRKALTGTRNFIDAAFVGERRAAETLQKAVDDPKAVAAKVREAGDDTLPGRASEEPELQALEARVLKDDPAFDLKTKNDLAALEATSLDDLATVFGPTSKKTEFQQTVIQRAAAPGAVIKPGQADEMLNDAADSFTVAYKESEGFPIRTEVVQPGLGEPLAGRLADATVDTRVIASGKTRQGIQNFLAGLLEDVSRRGDQVPSRADVPLIQLDSTDLIEMRQVIRQEVRDRAGPTASSKAKAEGKLLQNAADELTETLESQLPAKAAKALKATDARYKDFITVQGAVLKAGSKGLTPESLTRSIQATATSKGQFARGQRGDLGVLAETGTDIRLTLGKGSKAGDAQRAAQITRDMTPEQLLVAKADLADGLAANSTTANGSLKGETLLKQIKNNRETLKAAGYTDADFTRIETIGRQVKLAQARSPRAVGTLVNDGTGVILNLLARISGVKAGTNILKFFGGGGVAGAFSINSFTSKRAQAMIKSLNVDNAKQLVTAALRGEKVIVEGIAQPQSLFDALMLKNTDSLKTQALKARTINSFLLGPTTTKTDRPEEN